MRLEFRVWGLLRLTQTQLILVLGATEVAEM